jgi:uncharacterized membrane protein
LQSLGDTSHGHRASGYTASSGYGAVSYRWTGRQCCRHAGIHHHYSRHRFSGDGTLQPEPVHFHSFQCIFFWVALVVIHISLSIVGMVPLLIFVTFPLHILVSLGALAIWIILLIKANQGLMYKLPYIGDLAEKQANA